MQKKKLPIWAAVLNAALVVAIASFSVLMGIYGGLSNASQAGVFAEGTAVDGVALGGMAFEEGSALLLTREKQSIDAMRITVSFNGASKEFSPEELGIAGNAGEVLQYAYQYNKSGDALENFDKTQAPDSFFTEVTVDKEIMISNVDAFLTAHESAAHNATASFDPVTRTFTYASETTGVHAFTDMVCTALEERILNGDFSPLKVTGELSAPVEPEITREQLEKNTVLIGQYQTFATANKSRNINIELMCKAVNGLTLQPGETLSLNNLVGQRTLEKGFAIAPAIVDGQLTDDVGGGICQLAGTLYNAALLADMGIVERVRHTWPSDYLPIGLDATLNWNNKDLKLQNRSKYPLYIIAELEGLVVSVELYGQPLENDMEIVIENRIVKQTEMPPPQIIYTDKLSAGRSKTQVKSRPGYEVEVYRHYLKAGAVLKSEKISHDHFRARKGTVLMGTNEIIK